MSIITPWPPSARAAFLAFPRLRGLSGTSTQPLKRFCASQVLSQWRISTSGAISGLAANLQVGSKNTRTLRTQALNNRNAGQCMRALTYLLLEKGRRRDTMRPRRGRATSMELTMNSEHYPCKVAAVYPDSATAEAAVHELNITDLGDIEVVRLEPGAHQVELAIEPEREQTRDTVVNDTVTASVVGTAAGAVLTGAAALGAPALFVSAPVVGPLVVLGYGAMIGGTVGAIRGLKLRENMLSGLVKDALKEGYHVVIIHAASEQGQQRVQDVINTTMAEDTAHT